MMAVAQLSLPDETATLALAAAVAAAVEPGMLILLEGPLAAGKTTFARGFLRALGHSGTVKSPTFTVVESYSPGNYSVHHFDLYRINDPDELHYLGFDDFLASDAICLIEWPSRAGSALPGASLRISLTPGEGEQREARLETSLPRLKQSLEQRLCIGFNSVT
jgi:tRNA threonylcarbamoyladenosine biosynthesis protein TsaE